MREYLSRSFPVTSVLSLWTVIVSSGSAAARFPFAFFSFPATLRTLLFSSNVIFFWKLCQSLSRPATMFNHRVWHHKRYQMRRGLWTTRWKKHFGLWQFSACKDEKKTTWVLNIFESSRSIKLYIFLRKKENNKKNVQTNKQMKIQTKIKMKCFYCENEYFCNILFLKIICSTFKTQTHSSVLKINCV